MGFEAVFAGIITGALNDSAAWLNDFSGWITVIVGLGVFRIAVGIILSAVRG